MSNHKFKILLVFGVLLGILIIAILFISYKNSHSQLTYFRMSEESNIAIADLQSSDLKQ